MKITLPAAYFKKRFNRVSNSAITQDICTRLLGLLHAFVYLLVIGLSLIKLKKTVLLLHPFNFVLYLNFSDSDVERIYKELKEVNMYLLYAPNLQ